MIAVPEEIKGLLRVIVQENGELRDSVAALDRDVQALTLQYRRGKWERTAIVTVLLAVIVLGALFVNDALQRRAEFRGQLRDLACLAVRRAPAGVSATVDDLRARYDCPPYVAPVGAAPPRETVTPHALPGPTVTRTVPAPGPTVTLANRPETRVETRVVPRPVIVTRTVVRTVTVTATPTCRLLPGLLC